MRPDSAEQVAAIVAHAAAQDIPVVPQGGNTGLVGAQVPDDSGCELVLSLTRMNAIRSIDREGGTLCAEAGVVLKTIQDAADDAGLFFPISLGAEGSCQIGGNISTNAGGTAVLAYGNVREQVLGLEVVLANGEIWNGLTALRKDNTGYDLKQLFIGAEGTLGIITAATLRLHPRPAGRAVAFVGQSDPADSLNLLALARDQAGFALTGFEIMPRIGLDFVLELIPDARDPLSKSHAWYSLLEISAGCEEGEAGAIVESILAAGFETGCVADAAIAASLAQSAEFWHLRHAMSDAQRPHGGSIKHDVSVPVARVPDFIERASEAVRRAIPGCRPVPFGHVGDGNIHFNITQPEGADRQAFLARWDEINEIVHAIVLEMGGSISAEHGIGRLKRDLLGKVKPEIEIDLMRRIKKAFDPAGILSPGRIIPKP